MNDGVKVLDRETHGEGSFVFREGQGAARAYLIQKGKVEIIRESGGEEQRLGLVGKGSIFGEMALIDDSPRMASARALEATVLVSISRDVFESRMKKSDLLIVALLKIFAQNIRTLSALVNTDDGPAQVIDETIEESGEESAEGTDEATAEAVEEKTGAEGGTS